MINFITKADAVLANIRQRIVEGEFKPGQKIVISELAKNFGISEIPVREAIKKLESEGLVNFTPHVGAVVNVIGGADFLEIYLMRIELEALATKLSVPHLKDEDIAALNNYVNEAESAIEKGEIGKLGALNKKFHLRIYNTAPYPYLYKTIVDLWEKIEMMNSIFAYVPGRAVPSWGEHKKILEALEERNASLAARLVRQQKNRTKKALEKLLKKNDSQLLPEV